MDKFLVPKEVEVLYSFFDYDLKRLPTVPDPKLKPDEWKALDEKVKTKKLSFGMHSELINDGRAIKIVLTNAEFNGQIAIVGIGKKKVKPTV